MFDSDCSSLFKTNYVTIFNSDNTPLLKGKRNTYDVLWDIKISSSQSASFPTTPKNSNTNSVLRLDKSKSELVSCLYSAAVFPTK